MALACATLAAACGGSAPRAASPSPVAAPGASAGPSPPAIAVPPENDAGVPVGPTDPTWGQRLAPVTIVEFADFQCPYCARAEGTLARVRETYGPDTVRIVWKHSPLPFHPGARPVAEAAAGVHALAGNDAFWRFVGSAFAAHGGPDPHGDHGEREESYAAWADGAGVGDRSAFLSGLRAHAWASKVDADLAEAKDVGAVGTPWFFVNGVRLEGAQPFEAFRQLIDRQLAAARAKLAAGVDPGRLYAILSKENRAAAPPEQADKDEEEPEDTKTIFKVPLGSSPQRGGAAPLVTVVEFADYECPFCTRAEATLRELRADYGDKLRFVFRNEPLPFHSRAEPAAEAALEVRAAKGDAAFWTMHDALLDGNQNDLTDEALVYLATRAGANADKVRAAIGKHAHLAEIEADEQAADDFEANGTPHFFIDGRRLVGAQPKEAFVAIIDEEIKKAQTLLDHGTKPAALYDTLTREGLGPPEPVRADLKTLPTGDPAKGPATARVTIHEFADFECPFCARAEGTLKEVARRYGDKVRLVWHDLPLAFHDDAMPAARAAREAQAQHGDSGFWALHDRLFAEGAKLGRDDLDADARALGLDMDRWKVALAGDAHNAEVSADQAAAETLGFTGTPAFLVVPAGAKSGYVIVGAQSYAKFRKLIERSLGEAHR
jgi:protein-disulfide isomerase